MAQEIRRNLPRDVFLHLLAIVTLYWSSVTFVTLLWQYINYFFPDALNRYYNSFAFTGPIRFAISSLIIVFPVFILVSWYLNKVYRKEAAVRESKIRKWLLYLTLFIASLVIIGDLVAVINIFLNGEMTVRFILKALSVLLVAGVVLGYYLDDVRRETPTKLAKNFAWGTGAVVLVAVVGAFFVVGSPQSARLVQFDQQKIMDLENIQGQIVNYWQRKEVLPNSLNDLNDPISSFKVPVDPQTNQPYQYNIKYSTDSSALQFELCANFNMSSQNNAQSILNKPMPVAGIPDSYNQNWDHPAGDYCFERTIDPQLYPPLNKTK